MSGPGSRLAWRAGQQLRTFGWRVALVEAATGGAVTNLLTNVPGSSAYVLACLVPLGPTAAGRFDPEMAAALDSPTPAPAAAAWAREKLLADLGIAVTGQLSGLPGDTVEIAIVSATGDVRQSYRPRGSALDQQASVAVAALRLLTRHLSCVSPA